MPLSDIHFKTWIELDAAAFRSNVRTMRGLLGPRTRLWFVVKSNAYGHGLVHMSMLAQKSGIDGFCVDSVVEGGRLREAGIVKPILAMGPTLPHLFAPAAERGILLTISGREYLDALGRSGARPDFHLKIDSGMHRLGFMPDEIDDLSSRLGSCEAVRVVSVFSHLAASEDPDYDEFTHRQAKVFIEAAAKIREAAGYPFLRHICNSSAIIRFPEYHFDMVRPGIGIYGIGDFEGLDLRPAGRFRTRISQVKRIPGGEPVGYGFTDVSEKERIIAILPAGYADGLNRKLGNRNGSLFIKNTRVPIIGNICMDMCMADITGLNALVGDEAEIFGDSITIDEIAVKCETIPYEILTSIPARVKRIFFRE